jgi:hypothetical protein
VVAVVEVASPGKMAAQVVVRAVRVVVKAAAKAAAEAERAERAAMAVEMVEMEGVAVHCKSRQTTVQ